MDRQIPKSRKSGSWQAILGVSLSAFLLGALVVGYVTWDGTPTLFGGNDDAGEEVADSNAETFEPVPALSVAASPTAQETAAASKAVERVEEQQGGLDQRLAAAEQRLARLDLQAQAASGNAARAEGLLIAFATRRSLERGAELGYLADQLRLRFADALPNAVDTIIKSSRNPVTLDELASGLEALSPKLTNSSTEPSFSKFKREISELFVIRRESSPSPQPVRRIERAKALLQSGRVDKAIEQVELMPGAANAKKWLADAKRYTAVQRALDLIETAAVVEPQRLRDGDGDRIEQPTPGQESAPG